MRVDQYRRKLTSKGTIVGTGLPLGPTAGLQRQVFRVWMVFSSRPRPGLLITRRFVRRPSRLTMASTRTMPEYFALRASSEYGGFGVETARQTYAIYASVERAAAGSAAFTGTKATTAATPDTAALAGPDTAATTWTVRHGHGGGERITKIL